ncbi:MAG TPA: hypothetical protein VLF14_01755 [Candidatus Binatia bacterium]|nr:hypothetical protein [Candidatus Binatia bacterium]
MKRSIACLSLVAVLAMYGSALAIPQDEYDDSQSYPLRIAAYLLNPLGVGLEYAIFRPFHWLVSLNDTTELIFGHGPHGAEEMKALTGCYEYRTDVCAPEYSSQRSPEYSSQSSTQYSTQAGVTPIEPSSSTSKSWMK